MVRLLEFVDLCNHRLFCLSYICDVLRGTNAEKEFWRAIRKLSQESSTLDSAVSKIGCLIFSNRLFGKSFLRLLCWVFRVSSGARLSSHGFQIPSHSAFHSNSISPGDPARQGKPAPNSTDFYWHWTWFSGTRSVHFSWIGS